MWGTSGATRDKETAGECRRHRETQAQSQGGEGPLEEGMATHSSLPAWRTAWTEEPGGLRSMGLQRVGWTGLKRLSRHVQWYVCVNMI